MMFEDSGRNAAVFGFRRFYDKGDKFVPGI